MSVVYKIYYDTPVEIDVRIIILRHEIINTNNSCCETTVSSTVLQLTRVEATSQSSAAQHTGGSLAT